jgi:hypothetical protein
MSHLSSPFLFLVVRDVLDSVIWIFGVLLNSADVLKTRHSMSVSGATTTLPCLELTPVVVSK